MAEASDRQPLVLAAAAGRVEPDVEKDEQFLIGGKRRRRARWDLPVPNRDLTAIERAGVFDVGDSQVGSESELVARPPTRHSGLGRDSTTTVGSTRFAYSTTARVV